MFLADFNLLGATLFLIISLQASHARGPKLCTAIFSVQERLGYEL
jgi:hypothetical protein